LMLSSADTYVRNSPGGAVELHGRSLTETSLVFESNVDVAVCGGLCRRWAGWERES
jgi:hypothetical protein